MRRSRLTEPGPNRTRATELAESSPAPEKPFDPKRDITPEDWESFLAEFEKYRQDPNNACKRAMKIALLDADRSEDLSLDEITWKEVMRNYNHFRRKSDWKTVAFSAARIVAIAPERRSELALDDAAWDGILAMLQELQKTDAIWLRSHVMNMAILYPEQRDKLDENEEIWKALLQELEKERAEENWIGFATTATTMRLLSPKRQDDLHVDAIEWEGMLSSLSQVNRRGAWINGTDLASNMAILAADEIRITREGGLELVNHNSVGEETPLPNRPAA